MDQESDELVRYVTNLEEVNQELVLKLLKRIATFGRNQQLIGNRSKILCWSAESIQGGGPQPRGM